jgi:hypothetical protein
MSVLGIDLGNAKIKLCWGPPGEVPHLRSRPLPYEARRPYDRGEDLERGGEEAFRALLPTGERPSVAVVVTSAGYAYRTFREGVVHAATFLPRLLPGARVYFLSATLEPVAAERAASGDASVVGPIAFSNPNGAAFLARRLGALGPGGRGLSLDTGGQTTGTLVLDGDRVDPAALLDPSRHIEHRMDWGKLVWVGVETTPLEYLAHEIEVEGRSRPVIPRGVTFDNVSSVLGLLPPERAAKLSLFGLLPDRARALRALADAVNLDAELASEAELVALARAFHERAVDRLSRALSRAIASAPASSRKHAAVFGLGARALALPALERAGIAREDVVLGDELLLPELSEAASCFGAWHMACEIERGSPLAVPGRR